MADKKAVTARVLTELAMSRSAASSSCNAPQGGGRLHVPLLKALKVENARLKRIIADQVLEVAALRELSRETGEPACSGLRSPVTRRTPWEVLHSGAS